MILEFMYLTSKTGVDLLLLKNPSLNQIIIKKTITIGPNTSLLHAREILLRHNLKRLVVINSKKIPVGIIYQEDRPTGEDEFSKIGKRALVEIPIKRNLDKMMDNFV